MCARLLLYLSQDLSLCGALLSITGLVQHHSTYVFISLNTTSWAYRHEDWGKTQCLWNWDHTRSLWRYRKLKVVFLNSGNICPSMATHKKTRFFVKRERKQLLILAMLLCAYSLPIASEVETNPLNLPESSQHKCCTRQSAKLTVKDLSSKASRSDQYGELTPATITVVRKSSWQARKQCSGIPVCRWKGSLEAALSKLLQWRVAIRTRPFCL